MSGRTGLSDLHVGILDAVDRATVTSRDYRKCATVLGLMPAGPGHGPLSAYEELQALATEWTTPLPLLEYVGNLGMPGRDDPAAEAQYTECRLSAAGAAALAAERESGPPLPLGLVLGDWFLGGRRPSFDPGRVAGAVQLAARGDIEGAVRQLGSPVFHGGSVIRPSPSGEDPRALEYGWLVRGRIEGVVTVRPSHFGTRIEVHVVALPPTRGPSQVTQQIADVARALNRVAGRTLVSDVDDETTQRDGMKIVIVPAAGVDAEDLADLVRALPCLYLDLDLQLPRPAAELLGGWVDTHGPAATLAGAEVLAGLAGR